MEIDRALYWKLQSAREPKQGTHDICPVLTYYGLELVVQSPDNERPRLEPLIGRILGRRDRKAERKRADHVVVQAVRRILPLAVAPWPSIVEKCCRATEANAALRIAKDAQKFLDDAYRAAKARGDRSAYGLLTAEGAASAIVRNAPGLVASYAAQIAPPSDVWTRAFTIFEEAILLGRHEETGAQLITPEDKDQGKRMEEARKEIESVAMSIMRRGFWPRYGP